MGNYRVLAMNFGSTSTKIAVYDDETPVFEHVLRHSQEEMAALDGVKGNYPFRKRLIMEALGANNIDMKSLDAIVGRGGMMHPIPGGTYEVNQAMSDDLLSCKYGSHASNLGGILALEFGRELGKPAYIVDPVVVDELSDLARLTGHPDLHRTSTFHALNQKAVAKRYARERGKKYEELNLIVAHMGGGITVGAHEHGRVVDVNNGLDGDGPYSAERPGGLPVGEVMRLCYSGKYKTYDEIKKVFTSRCGLIAYLGTNDGREVDARIAAGDKQAELVYRGMAYQVAKEIGGAAAALSGKVDAILLTGGLAYDKMLTGWITERVNFIAEVVLYPGEDEMGALVGGALRVLRGEEEAKHYTV